MSIVFLGQIGCGKTTLYNKITGSEEIAKAGGASVTMNVFMKKSCFGSGFQVLDTPGFGSDSKKIAHIAGVLCALSQGPINRIIFIVKLARTSVIMEDVKRILPAFINYRNLITVIITCWDYCNESEKENNKKDIQQRLAQFKINSVMFVGKNDTSENICLQIDQIIASTVAESIKLTENDIFQNFDMQDYNDAEIFQIEMEKGECATYYHLFFQQAKDLIEKCTISKGLLADYFYALSQFAKQLVDETVRKFESKTLKTIDKLSSNDQLKAYQIHFELKSTMFKEYEFLVELAHKKTYNGNHFSKYMKKCNHCKEIWFKAAGCEGKTICGRLNENHLDNFLKEEDPPQKYTVTYINEKLQVKPTDEKKAAVIDEDKKRLNLETKVSTEVMTLGSETFKVGGAGCRKVIDWGKMLPLTEDELNTVLGILDIKMCEKMVEFEKLTQQKRLNQQLIHMNELQNQMNQQSTQIKKQ